MGGPLGVSQQVFWAEPPWGPGGAPRTASWLFGSRRSAPASSAPPQLQRLRLFVSVRKGKALSIAAKSPWPVLAATSLASDERAIWSSLGPFRGAGWMASSTYLVGASRCHRRADSCVGQSLACCWAQARVTPPIGLPGCCAPCLASLSVCSLPKSPEWALAQWYWTGRPMSLSHHLGCLECLLDCQGRGAWPTLR